MEKIHIGRTIFTMDAAAKNRLAAYLADLKDYVLAHDVEIDVYEDIESRIEERLAALRSDGEITHADIVRLIGEMGAPEAIFG